MIKVIRKRACKVVFLSFSKLYYVCMIDNRRIVHYYRGIISLLKKTKI